MGIDFMVNTTILSTYKSFIYMLFVKIFMIASKNKVISIISIIAIIIQ